MVNSFFFPRGCKFPSAPKWPCYLYGFGGLMEFVYLDLKDPDTGEWYINPAIFDKDEVTHVQDFRVADVMGTDGQMHRVRGYSGWYFHAMENTTQVNVNVTQQAEADPTDRSEWRNLVDYWYDRPQFVDPPVHNGLEFFNLDYLWKGLPDFGGHSFIAVNSQTGNPGGNPGGGSGGSTLPGGGGMNDFTQGYGTYRTQGPIAMSFMYGCPGDIWWKGKNTPALNHTMRFSMAGKCKVRLHGRTPIIGEWSSGGSWLPEGENDKIGIMPGQDKLIVIDGMRGIRVRTSGWFAHFGDHVIKKSEYNPNFIFTSSGNSVTYYNEGQSNPCEGSLFGQSTSAASFDAQGNTIYNNQMEVAAQHHWWIGQWCDNNPNSGLDRYSLDATLKLWKKRPADPVNQTYQRFPDPHKVIITSSPYDPKSIDTPADAIVYAKAQERQSVHAFDPNHETNGGDCNPDYAKSIGFVFTLPEGRDQYSYCHIEIKHKGHIVGACMGKAVSGVIYWQFNAIEWRATDQSIFAGYLGGLPIPSTEKDPNQEGTPLSYYHAMTVAMPFGDQNLDYLPKCGIYITTIGRTNVPYVIKSFTNIPSNIATPNSVTIDWGDGSATENATTIGTTFTHTYTAKGYYKIRITINYTMVPGITTDYVVQSGNELTHILVKDA